MFLNVEKTPKLDYLASNIGNEILLNDKLRTLLSGINNDVGLVTDNNNTMSVISEDLTKWMKMHLPWFIDEWDSLFWQKVAGFATGICITWYIMHKVWKRKKIYKRIHRKQASVQESCRLLVERLRTEGLTLPHRDRILNLSIMELQAQLQTGKLKAMEVLRAYQSKAMEANESLNCVVEPIWEAEAQATELDLLTGKKGPLHGIPVSIKEAFFVQGYDCTVGLQAFINKPVDHDAPIIQVLKKQGAIPFVRTNIPQLLMSFDSSNPIFGETKNPHNLSLSPGGSSSGEGALIAAGGSCLGLGNDIGGSIRIPSHMCGVCGLKPTVERLGVSGLFPLGDGQTLLQESSGPMGKDVASLALCMKALLVPALNKAWPFVQVSPFDNQVYTSKKPLRIGYFSNNGTLAPVPSVSRGMDLARKALQKKGHTLVKFEPPRVMYMFIDLFLKALTADEAKEGNSFLDNDIVDPCSRLGYYVYKLPYVMRFILSLLVQFMDADVAHVLRLRTRGVHQWFKLVEDTQAYKLEFVSAMKKQNLDALICPTMPVPAVPLGMSSSITAAATYPTLYNLLNFPAGCVPVTKVTEDDQKQLNDPDVYPTRTLYEKMAKKLSQDTEGLPVSVQCAALPYQEELVLRIMKEIEEGVAYR